MVTNSKDSRIDLWRGVGEPYNGLLAGREVREASTFFSTWPFSEESFGVNYDREWAACLIHKAPDWCFYKLAAQFAVHPTWQPVIDDPQDAHHRRHADCQYKFSLIKVLHAALLYNFHFVVNQFNCSNPGLAARGGTSFDIWARRDTGLVHCYTEPLTSVANSIDVAYEARCDVPQAPPVLSPLTPNPAPAAITNASFSCLRLTALLAYEHYDAFSEVLGSSYGYDYSYPPAGKTLVDDEEYCAVAAIATPRSPTIAAAPLLQPQSQPSIEYVSGVWLKANSSAGALSLFDWRVQTQGDAFLTAWNWRLSLWGAILNYNNVQLSNTQKLWHPKLSRGDAAKSYQYSFQYQSTRHPAASQQPFPQAPHRGSYSRYASKLAGTNSSAERHYYLMGSSHMRYNFDGVQELLYGAQVMSPDRKHEVGDYGNWHYRGGLYAANFPTDVKAVCDELSREGKRKATLVFQFGAWDLLYSTLRRLLHTPRHLDRVTHTLQALVNGSLPCDIDHIVWLTTVPYPYCFHEDDAQCWWLRSAHNNAAIAAINQALFAALPGIVGNNASYVSMSIVDAHAILLPRLALNDQVEVVCSNHFLCRIEAGPKTHKVLQLAHTPGGEAVLEALLESLYHRALR